MKTSNSIVKPLLILLLILFIPGIATADPVVIQTAANASNASSGESGASISSSALISVLVTNEAGTPLANLGASVGDGSAQITLPAGWTLFSNLNAPPGGCLLTPTEFHNWGNGSYNIRVVPFLNNPSCSWLAGDYHYVVTIKRLVNRLTLYKGSSLGVLTIQ